MASELPARRHDTAEPIRRVGSIGRGGVFRELTRNRALYGMAVPALIVLLFNNYIPMFGIIIAFKD